MGNEIGIGEKYSVYKRIILIMHGNIRDYGSELRLPSVCVSSKFSGFTLFIWQMLLSEAKPSQYRQYKQSQGPVYNSLELRASFDSTALAL